MNNKMRPIHPGEILRDELDALDMSANCFAEKLHVPANRITQILNGKRAITADTALRLSRFLGTTAKFWLNLQSSYDLKLVLFSKEGEKIEKDISFRKAA